MPQFLRSTGKNGCKVYRLVYLKIKINQQKMLFQRRMSATDLNYDTKPPGSMRIEFIP